MTKSKGVGRGGVRPGAGRRPKAVDWDAVGRAYYTGAETIGDILEKFEVSHGDLLAHAAASNWLLRKPTRSHPDDLGDMAAALALEIWDCDVTDVQRRRFVAAMVALNASEEDIADVLQLNMDVFKKNFAKQLAGTRW
jgi:hypothetical protein